MQRITVKEFTIRQYVFVTTLEDLFGLSKNALHLGKVLNYTEGQLVDAVATLADAQLGHCKLPLVVVRQYLNSIGYERKAGINSLTLMVSNAVMSLLDQLPECTCAVRHLTTVRGKVFLEVDVQYE